MIFLLHRPRHTMKFALALSLNFRQSKDGLNVLKGDKGEAKQKLMTAYIRQQVLVTPSQKAENPKRPVSKRDFAS